MPKKETKHLKITHCATYIEIPHCAVMIGQSEEILGVITH